MVSFSLKKPNDKKPVIRVEAGDEQPRITQIRSISASGVVEPTIEPIIIKGDEHVVIPCVRRYTVDEPRNQTNPVSPKRKAQTPTPGISIPSTQPPSDLPKKKSILMSIKEAKESGKIKDAPDVKKRAFDAEDFAWGVLRGMGFDDSKLNEEEALPKPRPGNHDRLGIGAALVLKKEQHS